MNNSLVSIVLLTKNAGCKIDQTLTAINNQVIDKPYEIVVVDSGSTDETLNILRNYNLRLFEIKPEEFNFGLTRDYGFSLARGEIIVTISQDVVPCNSEWLNNLVTPFDGNSKLIAVQGGTRIPINENVFYWEKIGQFYFTSEAEKWMKKYKCGLSFVNCAIRKDFWQGNRMGFCLHSEDKLFQKMIYDSGKDVFYAKDAICFHGHQYSLKTLVNRLVNEGVGWQHVGVRYGFRECLSDLYRNKYLIRKSIGAYYKKEIKTIQELLFPILRPILIFLGNKKGVKIRD